MTALFLFPHQDDEFGVFGLLDANARMGVRSICLFLTDGAAGRATATQRNDESLRVLSDCGVSSDDIHFIGTELAVADGRLVDGLDRLFAAVLRIAECEEVSSIYVPAWEGGHPDHDNSVLLGRALAGALRQPVKLRQFALYNAFQTKVFPFRVLYPLPDNGPCSVITISRFDRWQHLRRCAMYPSQWKTWAALLPAVTLRYQLSPQQILQPVLDIRLRQRPHEGALLYERRGWTTWVDQMQRSLAFRERHGLA